jgi:hypothetical protein
MSPKALKFFSIGASIFIIYLLLRDHHSRSSSNSDGGGQSSAPAYDAGAANRERAEQANIARRATLARIESLESDYRLSSQQLIAKKNDQAEYNGRVQNYVLDHKEACLALGFGIAGAGVLIQQDKYTSDGDKVAAGLAAGIAAVWVYNHADEAKEVGNALVQAQANQADYARQVASLQQQVDSTASELQMERTKLQ